MRRDHYRPKSATVHVRVRPAFRRDLLALCERQGVTLSDLMRDLLEAWAADHRAGDPR